MLCDTLLVRKEDSSWGEEGDKTASSIWGTQQTIILTATLRKDKKGDKEGIIVYFYAPLTAPLGQIVARPMAKTKNSSPCPTLAFSGPTYFSEEIQLS